MLGLDRKTRRLNKRIGYNNKTHDYNKLPNWRTDAEQNSKTKTYKYNTNFSMKKRKGTQT